MTYETVQSIAEMQDPGFLVDVVMRSNGRLLTVARQLDWEEATRQALSALEDGLQVEIEESEGYPGAAHDLLPGEIDRQS